MTPEELTQLTAVHQMVLTRHDSEMAEIREMMKQIGGKLDQVTSQQSANQEAIAHLTTGILDLRNVISDYIQGRSNP